MNLKKLAMILLSLSLLIGPTAFFIQPAAADPVYTCLPTCETNDGRMFTISGTGLATLVGIDINVSFAAPADATSLEIGIFDGDTGGIWDGGTEALQYSLFADPTATGSTAVQLNEWSGATMPDNDWFVVTIPTEPNARSASGHYFYHMRIRTLNPAPVFYSVFKVRSDGVTSLLPRPFAYFGALQGALNIIYPNYPDLGVTTYDGQFDFHTYLSNSREAFTIFDGDVDFGASDLSTADTDDPDTPNNVIPPWSSPSAVFEGVAVGVNGSTGNPPDDYVSSPGLSRSPSVIYDVAPLDQTRYANPNPSGNLEWEQFRISSIPGDLADHSVSGRLPAGLFHVAMDGMDLMNLNAWRFQHNVLGVCPKLPDEETPNPCKDPLHPKKIGDTVFSDTNRNGVQEDGEPGLPGVLVQLFDSHGFPLLDIHNNPITRVTDANGNYFFDVDPRTLDEYTGEVVIEGVYTVVVAESNFAAGGPLVGLRSTTGGNSQTNTVIDENVLTYDFGYSRKVKQAQSGVVTYNYWRSNPSLWPVDSVTIGGVEYPKEQAIRIMFVRVKGDKTLNLFNQLVAAILNIEAGNNGACIEADIELAQAWLAEHPVQTGVFPKSEAWRAIRPVYDHLTAYNSGRLCAPAMARSLKR